MGSGGTSVGHGGISCVLQTQCSCVCVFFSFIFHMGNNLYEFLFPSFDDIALSK